MKPGGVRLRGDNELENSSVAPRKARSNARKRNLSRSERDTQRTNWSTTRRRWAPRGGAKRGRLAEEKGDRAESRTECRPDEVTGRALPYNASLSPLSSLYALFLALFLIFQSKLQTETLALHYWKAGSVRHRLCDEAAVIRTIHVRVIRTRRRAFKTGEILFEALAR